jgi:hypothetical protein
MSDIIDKAHKLAVLSQLSTETLKNEIERRERETVGAAIAALDAVPDHLLARVVKGCRHKHLTVKMPRQGQ